MFIFNSKSGLNSIRILNTAWLGVRSRRCLIVKWEDLTIWGRWYEWSGIDPNDQIIRVVLPYDSLNDHSLIRDWSFHISMLSDQIDHPFSVYKTRIHLGSISDQYRINLGSISDHFMKVSVRNSKDHLYYDYKKHFRI